MNTNYIIRTATAEDIEQIAKLYIKSWKKTYRGLLCQEYLDSLDEDAVRDRWTDYIGQPRQEIFVAVSEEGNGLDAHSKVLGFGAFKPYHRIEDCIYIESLHVDESCQRQGIGTAIIEKIRCRGQEEQYGQMAVCIVKGNDNARTLYVKLGAAHYKDKVDDFTGEVSYSEILTWDLK